MQPTSLHRPDPFHSLVPLSKTFIYRLDPSSVARLDNLLDKRIISIVDPTVYLPITLKTLIEQAGGFAGKKFTFQLAGSGVYFILGTSFFKNNLDHHTELKDSVTRRLQTPPNDFDFQLCFHGIDYDSLLRLQEEVVSLFIQRVDPKCWEDWEKRYQWEILASSRSKEAVSIWKDPRLRKKLIVNHLFIQKKGQSGFTPEVRFSMVGLQVEGGWDIDLCFIDKLEKNHGLYSTESLKIDVHPRGSYTLCSPFGELPLRDYVDQVCTPTHKEPKSEAEWLRLIAAYTSGNTCPDPLWEKKATEQLLSIARRKKIPLHLYLLAKIIDYGKKHLQGNPDLIFGLGINACLSLQEYIDKEDVHHPYPSLPKKAQTGLQYSALISIAEHAPVFSELSPLILYLGIQGKMANHPQHIEVELENGLLTLKLNKPLPQLNGLPKNISITELIDSLTHCCDPQLRTAVLHQLIDRFLMDKRTNLTLGKSLFPTALELSPQLGLKIYQRMAPYLPIKKRVGLLKQLGKKAELLEKKTLTETMESLLNDPDFETEHLKGSQELCRFLPFLLQEDIPSARKLLEMTASKKVDDWMALLPCVYAHDPFDSFLHFHEAFIKLFNAIEDPQLEQYYLFIDALPEEEKILLRPPPLSQECLMKLSLDNRLRYSIESIEAGHDETACKILDSVDPSILSKKERQDIKHYLLFLIRNLRYRPSAPLRKVFDSSVFTAIFYEDPLALLPEAEPLLENVSDSSFWKFAKTPLALLFHDREWGGTSYEEIMHLQFLSDQMTKRLKLAKYGFQTIKRHRQRILEAIQKCPFSKEKNHAAIRWMALFWKMGLLSKSKENVHRFLAVTLFFLKKEREKPFLKFIHEAVTANCLDHLSSFPNSHRLLERLSEQLIKHSLFTESIMYISRQKEEKKVLNQCVVLLNHLDRGQDVLTVLKIAFSHSKRTENKWDDLIETQAEKFSCYEDAFAFLDFLPSTFKGLAEKLVMKFIFPAREQDVIKFYPYIEKFSLFTTSIVLFLLDRPHAEALPLFRRLLKTPSILNGPLQEREEIYLKLFSYMIEKDPPAFLEIFKNPHLLKTFFSTEERLKWAVSHLFAYVDDRTNLGAACRFFLVWHEQLQFPVLHEHVSLLLKEKSRQSLFFLLEMQENGHSAIDNAQKYLLFCHLLDRHPGEALERKGYVPPMLKHIADQGRVMEFLHSVRERKGPDWDLIKAGALCDALVLETNDLIVELLQELSDTENESCLSIIISIYFRGLADPHLSNGKLLSHLETILEKVVKSHEPDHIHECRTYFHSEAIHQHLKKFLNNDRFFFLLARLAVHISGTSDELNEHKHFITGSVHFFEQGKTMAVSGRAFSWSKNLIKAVLFSLKYKKLDEERDYWKVDFAISEYLNHLPSYPITIETFSIYRDLSFFALVLNKKSFVHVIQKTETSGFVHRYIQTKPPQPANEKGRLDFRKSTVDLLFLQSKNCEKELIQLDHKELVIDTFFQLCKEIIISRTPCSGTKTCLLLEKYCKVLFLFDSKMPNLTAALFHMLFDTLKSLPIEEKIPKASRYILSLLHCCESFLEINRKSPSDHERLIKFLQFCRSCATLSSDIPFGEAAEALTEGKMPVDSTTLKDVLIFFHIFSLVDLSRIDYLGEKEARGADLSNFYFFNGEAPVFLTQLNDLYLLHGACLEHAALFSNEEDYFSELSSCFMTAVRHIRGVLSKKEAIPINKYLHKDAFIVLETADPSCDLILYKHLFPKSLAIINRYFQIAGKIDKRAVNRIFGLMEKQLSFLFQTDPVKKRELNLLPAVETLEQSWKILSNHLNKESSAYPFLHHGFKKLINRLMRQKLLPPSQKRSRLLNIFSS